MKKVSTGERIKFADLRRRSVGVSRDADSDAAQSEQRFVSELMDTTPSSSYEGETLGDGYAYNPPDPSVSDSPLARYESDGEAADEVVTDTQEGIGKVDLIVKEDVPEIPEETQQGSLLAAGLAAVQIGAPQSGLGGLLAGARQRDDTMALSDGESLMGDPRVDHGTDHGPRGCTAEQLIRALASECKSRDLGSELTQGADKYVLRMADDDWDPDLDFPGLDSSAVITDVGVDQFVLCHQAQIEPMLHITIALHKGLNGPLTGTGAMEAPGAGASMTLEVDFQTPGQEGTHHMSVPIASDSGQRDLVRFRDSGLRASAASADAAEVEKLLRTPPGNKQNVVGEIGMEEAVKLRNMDTGEDITLAEIKDRVPPSLDPGEIPERQHKANELQMNEAGDYPRAP
ncbi:unnamed protein product [Ectocarpus sp. 4 AP-2014]